ncbi:caspase family protein [Rhizobium leguminosarum]|nr:caspase family protein [Rhizobium leguminosarum]
MTTVYLRQGDAPQTHAFLIGCGRFAALSPNGSADRVATAAGARVMARFLVDHADQLFAPLGSIEMLLSDPTQVAGQDTLGIGVVAHDPRADDLVKAATDANYHTAGDRWIDRCRPGDHMFFYMASHGVTDSDTTAVAVLEDIRSINHRPWAQSINITQLASALPTLSADGCWVFLDACQEVIPAIFQQISGAQSPALITPDITQMTRRRTSSVSLAGSRLGTSAWAPTDGAPPFFTQALIEGLNGASVEYTNADGWVVTGQQILFTLSRIANAALNNTDLQTESLTQFNRDVKLLRVPQPQIPVIVRTAVENHMLAAVSVTANDGNGRLFTKNDAELAWKFRVDPDFARYTTSAQFAGGNPAYQDQVFTATPPAQIVELME